MTAKTFDPKRWDLAVHFLADVPTATDDDREELAREFQMVAEDVIADVSSGRCPLCAACPGFIGAECDETCDHAKAGGF